MVPDPWRIQLLPQLEVALARNASDRARTLRSVVAMLRERADVRLLQRPHEGAFDRLCLLSAATWLGDRERALALALDEDEVEARGLDERAELLLVFFRALALLRARGVAGLETALERLARRSPAMREPFAHRVLILRAESLALEGACDEVVRAYDRAIEAARAAGYAQDEALACERAAEFYRAQGWRRIATSYRIDAERAYSHWGARAKVRSLAARWPLPDRERQRVDALRALRSSEVQLEAVLHSVAETLVVIDREQRIQLVNHVMAGREELPLLGSPIYTFASADRRDELRAILDEVLSTGETRQFETSAPHPDGGIQQISSTAAAIVVSGEVTGCIVCSRDITEERELEASRRELEARSEHAQKMEVIGRLAGGIAHDFNNTMAAIRVNVELLLEDIEDRDPRRRKLEQVVAAVRRSIELTSQLLAFSRTQPREPEDIAFGEFVLGLEPMLRRMLGPRVELQMGDRPARARVHIDPGQLEQVILNLVLNARDAMPEGGELRVTTADVELDDGFCVRRQGLSPGRHVRLRVRDTGCGMSPETEARIFEPFFTTKALGEGLGLGLAMVYASVEQCQGVIEVDSELGVGTSISVYLPVVEGREPSAEAGSTTPQARGRGETVLVVDDQDLVREAFEEVLDKHGYTVLSASHADEAIALAAGHAGDIDLLLTDVVMPRTDGFELAAQLVEARPGLRVLYMSGYTPDPKREEIGRNFLPKPTSVDTILATVREVLDADE